jgi:L-fuconolactonase
MLTRRELLGSAVALGLASVSEARAPVPVIDTHTHFYDPTRPEGVPWPGKDDKVLYRKVMPPEFAKLAEPHGVTGTVVVEASPRVEDNQWLLDVAKDNPIVVGVVGRLLPSDEEFAKHLKRFAKDAKFRGIRVNHDEVKAALARPAQRERLWSLTEFGLTLDVNGGPDLLADAAKLAEQLPKLTIVVNHLANPHIDGKEPSQVWKDGMKEVAERPNVYCKLSGLVDSTRKRDRSAPKTLDFYRSVIDVACAAFGESRLTFGSNWPVSDYYADYAMVVAIAKEYLKAKGEQATESVLGGNAVKVYGLKLR